MPSFPLFIPAMTCGHCSTAVSAALAGLPGVGAIRFDLRHQLVHVTLDQHAQLSLARQRLAAAGYPATEAAS